MTVLCPLCKHPLEPLGETMYRHSARWNGQCSALRWLASSAAIVRQTTDTGPKAAKVKP